MKTIAEILSTYHNGDYLDDTELVRLNTWAKELAALLAMGDRAYEHTKRLYM